MSNKIVLDQIFPGHYLALAKELPVATEASSGGKGPRHVILYRKLHKGDARIVVPPGYSLVRQSHNVIAMADDTEVVVVDL